MTNEALLTANEDNFNDETAPETVSTVEENITTTETDTETNDYRYVPDKFMSDGQPDFKKLTDSYKALEEKMGSKIAPESANDYEYDLNTELFEEDGFNEFKQQAHKLGLSQDQFSQLMDTYTSRMEAIMQNGEDFVATLKEDWGNDFDTNVQNAQRAFNALSDLGIDPDVAGTDPTVMKILSYFGSQMKEDSASNTPATTSRLTESEVSELMADPEYYENTPRGKEIRAKVEAYYNSM